MVRSGADIIEVDQKSDQIAVKKAAAGKATLLGPVDPSEVMANGTPQLVEEKCLEALKNCPPEVVLSWARAVLFLQPHRTRILMR